MKNYRVNIDTKKLTDKFEMSAKQSMKKIASYVYGQAIETYIPIGVSAKSDIVGRLASSLRERIDIENGRVRLEMSANTEYAKRVHEGKYRHVQQPSNRSSFMTYGEGESNYKKYRSGYEKKKDASPKYETKYFFKPMAYVMDNIEKFLEPFRNNFKK